MTGLAPLVLTCTRCRQQRNEVSFEGTQASLPPAQSTPFCQTAFCSRSSPVSTSLVAPFCAAPGGALVGAAAGCDSLHCTGGPPGTPVMVRTPSGGPAWSCTSANGSASL